MEKYGISNNAGNIRAQTDNRIIDSLSEAQDETAAENTDVQWGEGGIRH